MIRLDKYHQALYALHQVLVHARFIAYQREDASRIAWLLDHAEILPCLIAAAEDRTDEFREYLVTISNEFSICRGILNRFDENGPPSGS